MSLPFTAPVPLRRTTTWPGYDEAEAIPLRYGSTSGRCVQYNQAGTLWVWSDGACDSIQSVTVADQVIGGWQSRNDLDSAGQIVRMIELRERPIEAPVATGRARLDLSTGNLIESPADVVADLLRMCAIALAPDRLDAFRRSVLDLPVAGSVTGGTVQGVLREICSSIGAVMSPLHPGLCQLHPGGEGGMVHLVDGSDPDVRVSCKTARGDIVTRLELEFDVADDTPRQRLALVESNAADALTRTVRLLWVADARVANAVGVRLLQHWARPRWEYSASGLRGTVRPGDLLHITSRRVVDEAGITARVLRVSVDPVRQRSNVTGADAWV